MARNLVLKGTRLWLDPKFRLTAQFVLIFALLAASLMLTGTAYADGPSPGPVGG